MPVQTDVAPDVADADLFRALSRADATERERIQGALVHRYTGLVRWVVARHATPAIDRRDLEQVGFLGLVLAIQRFDPDRGVEFIAFARPTVQGEIRRYFRDRSRWIKLPRRLQETKALLTKSTERLSHRLGRAPTVAELAADLDIDEELVLEAMTVADHFTLDSLDSPILADDGAAPTLIESVGVVDPALDLFLDCRSVAPLLAELSERDRTILRWRFFEDLTQAEIGRRLGYSQMHISRLINQILAELRQGLQAAEALA